MRAHVSIRPSIRLGALFSHPGQVSLAALIMPGPRVQVEEPGGWHTLALHTCRVPAPRQPRVGGTGWGQRGRAGTSYIPEAASRKTPEAHREKETGPRPHRAGLGVRGPGWAGPGWGLVRNCGLSFSREQRHPNSRSGKQLPAAPLPSCPGASCQHRLCPEASGGTSRGRRGHAARRSQEAHRLPGTRAPTLPKPRLEDWLSHIGVRGGA